MAHSKKRKEDDSLVRHAKEELERASATLNNSGDGEAISKSVLELIRAFSKQNHDSKSAEATMMIFLQLAQFEVLTPVTDDPAEWESISEKVGYPMWRNRRGLSYFSPDGGKTWKHAVTGQGGVSEHKEVESETKEADK